MYKVVLVDDESIIVEGLKKIIPWNNYECEVIASAYDVTTAIQTVNEHSPDILFTDIRMPDGNGLTMLAGLRSQHPNMQVTILTGYKDFNYAQNAINLGVTRFLLKPSKISEIVDAVETMVKKLKMVPNKTASVEPEDGSDYVTSFIVREAMEFIQKNYANKINLSDVADACYVSQWHLSKLLSKNTGQSFYDLLNAARVNEAKRLLQDPALRIGEISAMVGYTDTPHFSRESLKKTQGLSPNDYRNSELK